jgi:phage repressor protein C with HTH and peptisase S24 domain
LCYEKNGIPLIPTSAFAGITSGEVNILEYDCERYVIPVFKDAEFLIPVKGDSMIPKYNSGDIVACKKLALSDIFFQWNKVYVIDTDQGVMVKRIHKGSLPDQIKIVSENSDFEPFDLPISRIHAIAIVIGVVRLE